MKPEGQIKHKLAQVRFRHLKREIRTNLSRRSVNCKFNGLIDLPGHMNVGVCLHSAEDPACWNGGSCDDNLNERASQCPLFETLNTKDSVRDEFDSFMAKADRAHIAERYPDMAALLWVLDLDKPGALPEQDEQDEDEEATPPEVVPQAPVAEPTLVHTSPAAEEVVGRLLAIQPWVEAVTPTPEDSPDVLVYRSGLLEGLLAIWERVVRFFRG